MTSAHMPPASGIHEDSIRLLIGHLKAPGDKARFPGAASDPDQLPGQ